jgi:chloramphenicol-sensitive protein RarD
VGPIRLAESDERRRARVGIVCGLAAYGMWGLFPIYFKAIAHIAPLEVLAHRVLWSVPLLLTLATVQGRVRAGLAALRNRRTLLTLVGTTLLIAGNWFVFIWSVSTGHVLQASLGYYINPLVNVLLGFVFLGERLRRLQTVSVVLAGVGVAYLTFSYRQVPGVALFLATSFGFYGLLRKTVKVDAVVGLTVETVLLSPLALGYAIYLQLQGSAAFGQDSWETTLLLLAAGVITAVPLLCFAAAARRLRLSTVGFLQYIAPTGQFVLAVTLFGETFTPRHLLSFAFIWAALALYSADTLILYNRLRRSAGLPG